MQHMRVSPGEKCDTCAFLPRKNATRASFSPGEMQRVRASPQEKCNRCAFLPSKESTHIIGFSPGETPKSRNYHGQRSNSKQHAISPGEKSNTCEFLPGRNVTHANFSPGEMRQVRISPQEKSTQCHIGFFPGRNPKISELSWPAEQEMQHMRVSPRE
jgi:hypothetical protein